MSVVRSPDDLADALDGARRVAAAAFDDDRLILERYVDGPRHVEVQVFADPHGHVIHLGERDCSLQRRHQKILEEAPAPNLDDRVRSTLHEAAVAFATRASYVGAGTCEFLVAPDGSAGFIEMNARLQVEHPVTEMVTGLDLVAMQLRTAMGEPLGLTQRDVTATGHAIEVRVYAEDPRSGFVPQAGRVLAVDWPQGVRVDGWIEAGTEVSTFYDPLLAKIVVHDVDRPSALAALDRALSSTVILGPRTNVAFLAGVVGRDAVRHGRVTTDWLGEQDLDRFGSSAAPDDAWRAAAAAQAGRIASSQTSDDPFTAIGGWRALTGVQTTVVLRSGEQERAVRVAGRGEGDDAPGRGATVVFDGRWFVWAGGDQWEFEVGPAPRTLSTGAAHLDSPLPGRVVAVRVSEGDAVAAGDELVVVEAMKMEHAVKAPSDGVVRAVLCEAGDQVVRGQTLVDLDTG
jgi:acetyl/propionyl-CoA carboxylase alpha subunit